MASSLSSSQSWNYDVFLSFRGEDTRKTFVDHLYSVLEQQGIYTYKDDETLPRGECIGPSLLKAIKASQISVIIFSKNYADSSWCLDELATIMECRDERGQIVMPIFYDVDPSHVRKQEGEFGKAFSKQELANDSRVESWRKALVGAANLSGWEPKHIADGHESKCIKEIVDTISHRLHPLTSSDNTNLIGIEARVQDLRSCLRIELGGVCMVGIWGVGGGGKSTLAFSVYKEVCNAFDCSCFVENIREESSKFGLKKLQEKVLCDVLKLKQVVIGSIEEGRCLIKSRLRHKNVLIVLDDVDHLDHLKALVGSHDWFGEGSRIIITTRDNHLLNAHKVNMTYNISLLNDNEAIQLFRKHAPREYRPIEDYETLSQAVVSYAGGLPLALKVLGSFLCDKGMDEWRSALARLKDIPDNDIVEKLKISYDGLKPMEKELFLDIACFMRRMEKYEAMMMLDACGFHPVIGVKVLIQKALITISNGRLDMHDLVQEMGLYIVRGEHPNDLENQSRIWRYEDMLNICTRDATMENDKIEAVKFYSENVPPPHLPQVVASMKKLRFLDVSHLGFTLLKEPGFLSSELRWISWHHYPANSLPTNFQATKLCSLILKDGLQEQLWKGYKGNAIENHFMSFKIGGQEIPKRFVPSLVKGKAFTLHFPRNWYNDFSGFLMCIATMTNTYRSYITITMKHETDALGGIESDHFELWNKSNHASRSNHYPTTCVGYVPFSSLRHTTWWNSTYNMISFSFHDKFYYTDEIGFGVGLVPRKNKSDQSKATNDSIDCSEFWDEEGQPMKTFEISRSSKSFLEILWSPW